MLSLEPYYFRILERFSSSVRQQLKITKFSSHGANPVSCQCPLAYALELSAMEDPDGHVYHQPPALVVSRIMGPHFPNARAEELTQEAYDFIVNYERMDWQSLL